jgi:hypothetical protein
MSNDHTLGSPVLLPLSMHLLRKSISRIGSLTFQTQSISAAAAGIKNNGYPKY